MTARADLAALAPALAGAAHLLFTDAAPGQPGTAAVTATVRAVLAGAVP